MFPNSSTDAFSDLIHFFSDLFSYVALMIVYRNTDTSKFVLLFTWKFSEEWVFSGL